MTRKRWTAPPMFDDGYRTPGKGGTLSLYALTASDEGTTEPSAPVLPDTIQLWADAPATKEVDEMDPDATWAEMVAALAEGDEERADELGESLAQWIAKGGYVPAGMLVEMERR